MNGLQFFVHNDSDAVRIEVAGSLGGADVETVHRAWQRAVLLSARAALKPVIVDITFITEADEQGRALLAVMHRSGARIVSQSPESSAIAQPIVTEPIEIPSDVHGSPASPATSARCRTSGTSRDSHSYFGRQSAREY